MNGTTETIRVRRLQQLIDEDFDGIKNRLATRLERQPSYIKRVLDGKKGFGEDLARSGDSPPLERQG